MGATASGTKELVAVQDGFRESEQSWLELLVDLKSRGLVDGPELVVGDGALGFWKAVKKVYPKARCQRCWMHKTGNILNKLPKKSHGTAKKAIQDIWMAQTKEPRRRPSTRSRRPTERSTRRRSSASSRTGKRSSPSTTSLPSTGGISEPRTRSSPPSPR